MRPCRCCRWDGYAIGSLKTIATAQAIFRDGDKEADGLLDFGTLTELSATQLVDGLLGSGTKHGYLFRAAPSTTAPELRWWATADPVRGDGSGLPFLAINQDGIVYRAEDGPIAIDPSTCAIDTRTARPDRARWR